MRPTFKIFTLVLGLFLLACGMAAIAQTAGNVMVIWPTPPAGVTTYVYEGTTAQNMTQQPNGVAAPGVTYLMTLAPGHYCFSAIMQNATTTSPFAPTVCANVTATGLTVIAAPAAPIGFGAG